MGYRDEGNRKKTKHSGGQWKERRRERKEGTDREGNEESGRGRETRNNRPITWVTGGDRSRERPGTEVYAMAANATRAAKPIHKARRAPPTVDVGSFLILILLLVAVLLVVVSVAAVAGLDGGMIG